MKFLKYFSIVFFLFTLQINLQAQKYDGYEFGMYMGIEYGVTSSLEKINFGFDIEQVLGNQGKIVYYRMYYGMLNAEYDKRYSSTYLESEFASKMTGTNLVDVGTVKVGTGYNIVGGIGLGKVSKRDGFFTFYYGLRFGMNFPLKIESWVVSDDTQYTYSEALELDYNPNTLVIGPEISIRYAHMMLKYNFTYNGDPYGWLHSVGVSYMLLND